jgi:hypothetical protein
MAQRLRDFLRQQPVIFDEENAHNSPVVPAEGLAGQA